MRANGILLVPWGTRPKKVVDGGLGNGDLAPRPFVEQETYDS